MAQNISISKVTKAAHAMQNVLLILQAHTEMLFEQAKRDDATKLIVKEAQAIYFNTRRLSRLLDSLMLYENATGELLRKESVDLSALLLSLVQEYRVAFPSVLFVITIPAALFVAVDKEKLLVALRNVLDNAIKYGLGKGGNKNKIVLIVSSEPNACIISIADQGQGIDAQDLPKVFLPFYRGRSGMNNQGSGLGLAICQEIIRLHGGKVILVSKKNKGVEVLITIPL
ncbi:MAG: HAMP domain-containing histidine kinase [Candidatus Abawacabacteria bacterium]|nr:HAMP domain-containing histidine kinase [Candidatus Abawacabacteria bacterium]